MAAPRVLSLVTGAGAELAGGLIKGAPDVAVLKAGVAGLELGVVTGVAAVVCGAVCVAGEEAVVCGMAAEATCCVVP